MDMKRIIIGAWIATILFALVGCMSRSIEQATDYNHRSLGEQSVSGLSYVEFLDGEIWLIYQERVFVKATQPEASSCFWLLDCSYGESIGTMRDGKAVYAIKEDEIEALILLENSGTLSWYVSEDISMDICAYSLEDFRVEPIQGEVTQEELDKIWEYHTEARYADTGWVMIDKAEHYSCLLISKAHPWMVYALDYCYTVPERHLYIYNVPNDDMVFLTQSGESVFDLEK